MNSPGGPSGSVDNDLRELLALDRTLSPSERKVLETLLLRPGPATARELARRTGTNLQGLYGAIDRLVARGLVARESHGKSARLRASPPTVVLQSLIEPGRRTAALAAGLAGPLTELYEAEHAAPSAGTATLPAATTTSARAMSGWLVDLLGRASGEVWFLGDESAWFPAGGPVERTLARRKESGSGLQVRMLVPPPAPDDPRGARHDALRSGGVAVRYSGRFAAPAVIVDRRWLVLRTGEAPREPSGVRSGFVKIDAPDLCRDLLRAGQDAWARADVSAPSAGGPGRPGRSVSGRA